MKKLFLKKAFVAMVFMIAQLSMAQKTYQLQSNPDLRIAGTSTLHDWEMTSTTATGSMSAAEQGGKLTAISSLTVSMPAESIKSGKNGMDKKAYEALKTGKNKNIVFTLKSATKSGNTWTLNGTFNIAGTNKDVAIKVQETYSGGSFGLTGTYSFKLTEYGIKPPTAMMGTIKTGNDVKMTFNVKFK